MKLGRRRKRVGMALSGIALGSVIAGYSIASAAPNDSVSTKGSMSQGAAATTGDTVFHYGAGYPTTGIANPESTNNNYVDINLSYMTLALYKGVGSEYMPVLAKSWDFDTKKNTLTVHLNPKAKWSDGSKLTAQDVYVSFELQFMNGNAQSFGLSSMKVVNPQTIVFYKNPHFNYSNAWFLRQVLFYYEIVPSSMYQQFIPSNLWTLVKQAAGNPKAKSTISAGNTLTAAATKASSYNFPLSQLLYDGPWSFSKFTPSETLYVKNPNYIYANRVTADEVTELNQTSNDVTWRALENGQLDMAGASYSAPVYKAVMSVHQNHALLVPKSHGMAIFFDQNTAPFNQLAVRQAIAYILNRNALKKIAEPIIGIPSQYQDGMIAPINKLWLTPSQLKTMKTYSTNDATATRLLESVGMKKTSKGWMLPNGKPFTFNVYAPNYTDWAQGADAIASELQQFGIKSSASVVDSDTYFNEQALGKYPVYEDWWGGADNDPSQTYLSLYIQTQNYNISSTGGLVKTASVNPVGVPNTLKVPGVGTINPTKLTVQLSGNLSNATEKSILYKLAKATNYDVPYIPIWSQAATTTYSTANWTWPNMNNSALRSALVYNNMLTLFQSMGLMKPKH